VKICHITPGAGEGFYCENCLRDDGIVKSLRATGHDAMMVPMYLPPLAEGPPPQKVAPVFFGGINVYLQQKSALFRRTPRWIDRMFDAKGLLRWAARMAGMTKAATLGETTLSMLRGEDGRQAKELRRLTAYLAASDRPDVVVLSNALLAGLAREIRRALGVPVVCMLHDEEGFLDALPERLADQAWQTLGRRCRDIDAFVSVSRFYADLMTRRLGLEADRVHVVHVGLETDDYSPAAAPPRPQAIGFLSPMTQSKGPDVLADAFVRLKGDPRFVDLRLRFSGGRTAADKPLLKAIRRRLTEAGVADDAEVVEDFRRPSRIAFLQSLSAVSVPTVRGEAFGLFVLEALACGVPLVLPAHGAFLELADATGGIVLCEPNSAEDLTDKLANLLTDGENARELARRGRQAVLENFNVEQAAQKLVAVYEQTIGAPA